MNHLSTMIVSLVRQLVYAGGGLARVKKPAEVSREEWEALLTGIGNRGVIIFADKTDVYTMKVPARPPEIDEKLCRPIPEGPGQGGGSVIQVSTREAVPDVSVVSAIKASGVKPESPVEKDHPDIRRVKSVLDLKCEVCGDGMTEGYALTICGCGVALCHLHREDPHGRARHRASVPIVQRPERNFFGLEEMPE